MNKAIDQAAREAIEASVQSARTLAEEAGVTPMTVSRWRTGQTTMSPESARALAHAIRARALRALDAASRLEAVADYHGEEGGR